MAITLALALGGVAALVARADIFNLNDGSTLEGEVVSATERGLIVRLADGKYSERLAWDKFSQEALKKLGNNPKSAKFAAEYIIEEEPPESKKPAKPAIAVTQPPRLDRSASPALLGGMFSSGLGLVVLLLLYAGNIWSAYEVSIFRAQPVWLVCSVAAVLPVLGQIIFLAMPTRLPPEDVAGAGEAGAALAEGAEGAHKIGSGLKVAYATPETADTTAQAATTVFKRGEFMFNRRFFETRFANFFGMIRRDKDKHLVLVIKTSRGEFAANRVTRITANDMHIEVLRGGKPEELSISFVEVQEVQLKHRDAH